MFIVFVRVAIVIAPGKLASTFNCTAKFDMKTNFHTTMCLLYMLYKNIDIEYIAKHLVLVMEKQLPTI